MTYIVHGGGYGGAHHFLDSNPTAQIIKTIKADSSVPVRTPNGRLATVEAYSPNFTLEGRVQGNYRNMNSQRYASPRNQGVSTKHERKQKELKRLVRGNKEGAVYHFDRGNGVDSIIRQFNLNGSNYDVNVYGRNSGISAGDVYEITQNGRTIKRGRLFEGQARILSKTYEQQSEQSAGAQQQQTAQSQPEQEVKSKKPIFRVNLSGDNLDGKAKLFFNVEGVVPYLRVGNNLFAVQGTGRYSSSNGSDVSEADIGQVFNHLFSNGSLAQAGAFYQYRHDTAGSLDFKVGSVSSSYQSGRGKFSVYFAVPLSKGLLTSSTSSSQISESQEGRVTSTKKITVDEMIYAWARKVATARVGFQATSNFGLDSGIVWYSGSKGYTLEGSNFVEVRGDVPSELRAIIGVDYSSQAFSNLFFRRNAKVRVEYRTGQGGGQASGLVSVDLNRIYQGQDISNLKANLATRVDNLERIITANSWVRRTTKEKSPAVSVDGCPDTAQEGSLYVCRIDTDGTVEVVKGPSFLALSGSNSSNASSTLTSLASAIRAVTYSGEIDYDSAGSHPIELWIKNQDGLITKVRYTLVVQNTNRAPRVILPSETLSVNDGEQLETIIKTEDPDREHQGKLVREVSYMGGNFPSWATVKYSANAINLTFDPGYSNSGVHKFSIKVTDPEGLSDEKTLEVRINNVNRPPSRACIIYPERNVTLTVGKALDALACESTDPDGDTVNYTWNLKAVNGGRVEGFPRYGRGPISTEFPGNDWEGTYSLTVTNSDGKEGTTSNPITIKVERRSAPIPTLEAICKFFPNPANTNQPVTLTVTPSGGTGTYTHNLSGTENLVATDQTTGPYSITKSYSTSGIKEATDTLRSGDQTATANCSVTINAATTTTPAPAPPPAPTPAPKPSPAPLTPAISIGDVVANEGNAGTTNFAFNVNLSTSTTNTVTVQYTTVDGTATAGSDYTAIPATTLTFNPGETSKTINVSITGDTTVEGNETFNVNLSNPSNATISDGTGVGTITNDDAAPPLPPPPVG